MKKLLVIALSAIMVLSMAVVSMAAVTVGGEVNYGFNLSGPDTLDDPATPLVDESGKFVESDFGDAKITVTADLNDEVSAFVAIKTENFAGAAPTIDKTYVTFKEGFGSVKVGYYDWNIKDNVDILDAGKELKDDAVISVDANVAEGLTVSGALVRPDDTTSLGLKVSYKTDAFGASVGYAKEDADEDASIALNGSYNLTPAVVYLTYTTVGDVNWAILGATYDSDSIYGRVEFEAVCEDGDEDADSAIRVGYKLGNGAKIEYNTETIDAGDAVSSIKLKVEF